jgi:hypothetical protein
VFHALRAITALSILTIAIAEPSGARELSAMSGEEIKVLQQRLSNAGCYRGAFDGKATVGLQTSVKACPDQEPALRIETGMHVGQISNMAVDAHCSVAATGSDDKTVRLWSMPDGKPLRVQRLPIDSGAGGKVNVVAVSADGQWVAASVDDAHMTVDFKRGIYLFDAATGASIRRIGALDDAFPLSLAFSPDGRQLAAALQWGGVRVWRRRRVVRHGRIGMDRAIRPQIETLPKNNRAARRRALFNSCGAQWPADRRQLRGQPDARPIRRSRSTLAGHA